MYRIGLSLLMMTSIGQAWSADRPINPSRLQQQIERHAEQANKTLPGSSREDTRWMRENEQEHAMPMKQGVDSGSRGYGRGYEQRYGASESFPRGADMPQGAIGTGGFGSSGMPAGPGGRGHR